MKCNLILYNCNTINEDGEAKAGVDISISEGKIKDIDNSRGKLDEYFNNNEVVDCTNFYITPGFVNLHTHSPMNIFRGIAEDVTIDDWFNKEI
jgi:5-methylthioadenosine/S-adenosylhomocysteine deaminase